MAWLDLIFGNKTPSPEKPRDPLRWTSHRGDEWWCGNAVAGYSCSSFTIGSFGGYTSPNFAMELILDARNAFPNAIIDIYLDCDTENLVRTLHEHNLIESREIQLSSKTRVARIEQLAAPKTSESKT